MDNISLDAILGQEPVSIGRYIFDEQAMEWQAQRDSKRIPQALTSYKSDSENQDITAEQFQDNLISQKMSFKFTYKLHRAAIMKIYPTGRYQLRTTYQLERASQAIMTISVGEVITHVSLNAQGYHTHDTVFGIGKKAEEGEILYQLSQGRANLRIQTVELLILPDGVNPLISSLPAVGDGLSATGSGSITTDIKSTRDLNGSAGQQTPLKIIGESQRDPRRKSMLRSASKSILLTIDDKEEEEEKAQADIDQITQHHEDNNLVTNLSSMQSLLEYQKHTEIRIPLDLLYEVETAELNSANSKFCAVHVHIKDTQIKAINNGMPYLLQIWKRGGVMVFERPLQKPVQAWRMNLGKFLFKEDANDQYLWMVSLWDENRPEIDRRPQIFKFTLPMHAKATPTSLLQKVTQNDLSSAFEFSENGKSNILNTLNEPADFREADISHTVIGMDDSNNLVDQTKTQIGSVSPAPRPKHSVLSLFADKVVVKQPQALMDVVISNSDTGVIVFAGKEELLYFEIGKYLTSEEAEHEVEIQDSELKSIKLCKGKKIVDFPVLDQTQSCIAVDDEKTHQVDFMAYKLVEDKNGNHLLSLCGLNVVLDASAKEEENEKNEIVKFLSTTTYDEIVDKWTQICLLLRVDGSIEVFVDFILKNRIYNQERQCIDIGNDDSRFYFKMVKNSHLVTADTDTDILQEKREEEEAAREIEIEYWSVLKFWRNRIGERTIARDLNTLDGWNEVIHKRVSPFVLLYSEVTNFATYMIVAHRHLLSIYDLGIEKCWTDTVQLLSDSKNHIRNMQIKKRPKVDREEVEEKQRAKGRSQLVKQTKKQNELGLAEFSSKNLLKNQEVKKKKRISITMMDKFQIACLIGTSTLAYIEIDNDTEKFKRLDGTDDLNVHKLDVGKRVLSLVDDKSHAFGMTILCDNGPQEDDFSTNLGCILYTFPQSASKLPQKPEFVMQCVKMQRIWELISSNDKISDGMITSDCSFGIRLASRKQFKTKNAEGEDQFKKAFKSQPIIKTLSVTLNGVTKIFPLMKEKIEDYKKECIVKIIQAEKNTKKFVNEKNFFKNEKVLEAFYTTNADFQQHKNSYLRISHSQIHIFDPEGKHVMTYRNLKFQKIVNVQQSFFYAACDNNQATIELLDEDGEVIGEFKVEQDEGVYVYNVKALLSGSMEPYKVSRQGLAGEGTLIQYNSNKARLSFMEDYNTIVVIPVPQLNVVNFGGMKNKHDYVIWREKNGFFTALDREGELNTWSLLTGNLLYTLTHEENDDASEQNISPYQVYRSADDDITYTRDAYKLDDHSICLLRSIAPLPLHEDNAQNFQGMSFVKGLNIFQDNQDCHIEEEKLDFETYHFKVMQLETFQDTGLEDKVKVKFQFNHRLIKKNDDGSSEDEFGGDIWHFEDNAVQRLYLSKDTLLLLEVINNEYGSIYERFSLQGDRIKEPINDTGQYVKWVLRNKLANWPTLLCDLTSTPYLFSDNFSYRMDFDFQKKTLKILETATQQTYLTFPVDMINTEWEGLNELDAIDLIFSRMMWFKSQKENRLRIVTQANLDCIYEICETNDKKEPKERYLKLISVCKIDNLNTDKYTTDSKHYFLEPYTLKPNSVTERLIRMNQNYKTAMQHAINLNMFETKDELRAYMLEQIIKIDYEQLWGLIDSFFAVQVSFTWLDWLITEEAISNENFCLSTVSDQQKLQLVHNIFPSGAGILHKLAMKKEISQVHIVSLTTEVFELSKNVSQVNLAYIDKPVLMEVPFLKDLEFRTPLDITLGIDLEGVTQMCSDCKNPNKEDATGEIFDVEAAKNLQLTDIMLSNIADYGFMHSSQMISLALIEGTRQGLPAVKTYLESRVQHAEHPMLGPSHHLINESFLRNCTAIEGDYGYIEASMWGPQSEFTDKLFMKKGSLLPTRFETIDLPELFQNGKLGLGFIKALTECVDGDFFNLKSVQVVIDHHYYRWYNINLLFVVLPAFTQLICFWIWNNFVLTIRLRLLETAQGELDDIDTADLSIFMRTFIGILTLYLLIYDFSVLISRLRNRNYIRAMWQGIPTVLHILVIDVVYFADDDVIVSSAFWSKMSWVALAIWLRIILIYLGNIKQFSWLVGLIRFSFLASTAFIVVFFFFVTAFADSFTAIKQKILIQTLELVPNPSAEALKELQDGELNTSLESNFENWLSMWQGSFRTSIGDFDGDQLATFNYLDWLTFFIAVFIIIILMLNLLISVIAQAQDAYTSEQDSYTYRERANLVRTLASSYFRFCVRKSSSPYNLLYIVQQARTKGGLDEDQGTASEKSFEELSQLANSTHDMLEKMMEANEEAALAKAKADALEKDK